MLDAGVITEEEFKEKKAELLDGPKAAPVAASQPVPQAEPTPTPAPIVEEKVVVVQEVKEAPAPKSKNTLSILFCSLALAAAFFGFVVTLLRIYDDKNFYGSHR